MRATRMVAALIAALALTVVTTASAAGHEAEAPRTTLASVPNPAAIPAPADVVAAAPLLPADLALPTVPVPVVPALPATPDPSAALGALGDVINQIAGLLSEATSTTPDPAAVQQLVATLQTTLQSLIAQLPAAPAVTAPTLSKTSGPATLLDQLATLRAQAQALATATHPRPAAG
ncbi:MULTISPECIES: hypothetical protein [unclassified Kitasatospora]|uniref:hypothetical protein n=1 Tax=unclassified Kitasatospora TaxID=2633591 RepID=UPI003805FFBD